MIIPDNMILHIGKIFSGEYDIPYYEKSPTILDIGANIGGFAVWASKRWENSNIFCYEPVKKNYDLLKINTKDIDKIKCYNYAIGDDEEQKFIFYGKYNVGQASFFNTQWTKSNGEFVSVKSAKTLPKADIVKIDAEGSEIQILTHMIIEPDVIVVEYHPYNGIESHTKLTKILNYIPYSIEKSSNSLGIIKYFHKNIKFDICGETNHIDNFLKIKKSVSINYQ